MIKKIIKIFLLFFLFGFITINNFHYERKIITPENIKDNISKIYIDEHIYENINNNYSNIRIFNKNNKEVSYYIRDTKKLKTRKENRIESFKILSFKKKNNNSVELTCLNPEPKKIAPYKLNIVINNKNFEKKVNIAVSDDNKKWVTINQNLEIYDYSQYINIRKDKIDITKKNKKYYKITIRNFAEKENSPFKDIIKKLDAKKKVKEIKESFSTKSKTIKIEKLNFYISEQKSYYVSKINKKYNLDILNIVDNNKLKETHITINSKKILLNKIIINTPDYNFKRFLTIKGSDDNKKWIKITRDSIYKISINNINKEDLKVNLYNPVRYKFLKLIIKNEDNSPIKINNITGTGYLQEIVFFYKPEFGNIKLCYGGTDIPIPIYDANSVLEEIPYTKGSLCTLSNYKKLPGIKPIKETKNFFSSKTFLIIIVSLMVIVLIIIISFSIKKIENIE